MQERKILNNRSSGKRPIILTTDFGLIDAYVGVMKGVILGINPRAVIVDLTHQIQPQNILQASFTLATSYRFFPNESIHAVVVDPGVGTTRQAILLVTPHGRFLAPDNGVLSGVLGDYVDVAPSKPGSVSVPDGLTAISLTNPTYWLEPVSQTFHGRDVFAPVAAHLSMGVSDTDLGDPIGDIVWLPAPQPVREGNTIRGEIIVVDHFGNLVSNIPASMLSDGKSSGATAMVEIGGQKILGLSRTFHDDARPKVSSGSDALIALIGSNGYLEFAYHDGSAAALLEAGVGEPVRVVVDS